MRSSGGGSNNPKCTFQRGPIIPTFAEDIQFTGNLARREAAKVKIPVKAKMLIDGTGASPSLTIENGLVTGLESGSGVAAPVGEDIEGHDYSDYYLVPGLIDAHVHLVYSVVKRPKNMILDHDQTLILRELNNAQRALAAGITTVADRSDRQL